MAPTVDRGNLVEKAAAMVQRGELSAALSEYVRLFQRHPDDWNIANTLGDLYVRVGKTDDAIAHFTALAERLAQDGFTSKARALFRKILRVRPNHEDAKRRVAELDRNSAGASPFLQRVLQTAREAREAHSQERSPEPAIAPSPQAVVAAVPMPVIEPPVETAPATTFASEIEPPRAAQEEEWQSVSLTLDASDEDDERSRFFRALASADAAIARYDYTAALNGLEAFLESSPHHIGALEKLIDVGVEARLNGQLQSAQERLMEACRVAGLVDRARYIADDLRERYEPASTPEPESEPEPEPEPIVEETDNPNRTLEELRVHVLQSAAVAAEERFAAVDGLIAARQPEEAVAALEEAMCLPHLRVAAGAHLARFYRDTAAPLDALACLEWVAEMPPANEEEGHELAYELALTLEALDQQPQALGVYRELLAEVGPSFRDVAERAERLAAR